MPTTFLSNFAHQRPTDATLVGNAATRDAYLDQCLAYTLIKEMIRDDWFTIYSINDASPPASSYSLSDLWNNSWTRVHLKPTAKVDPLIATDPWMIRLEVKGTADARVSNGTGGWTNGSITDRGLYVKIGAESRLTGTNITGASLRSYPFIPHKWFSPIRASQNTILGEWNRPDMARISEVNTFSFRLTMVERGFAMAAWPTALTEDTTRQGLIVVQRGVNCAGDMTATGQKPLFLLTNCSPEGVANSGQDAGSNAPQNNWYYQIIRQAGSSTPYPDWNNNNNSSLGNINGNYYVDNLISDPREMGGQILNYYPVRWEGPVTNDLGDYILIFPYGLTSERYVFSDELDLIAISKGKAYKAGQTVPLNVFGQNREYTALSSNSQHPTVNDAQSSIRVFMLTGGPDFQ